MNFSKKAQFRDLLLFLCLVVGIYLPSSAGAAYGNYGSPGLRALAEIVFFAAVVILSIRLAFKSPKRFVITDFSWIFVLSLAIPIPVILGIYFELKGIWVVVIWVACVVAIKYAGMVFPYLEQLEKEEEKKEESE